MKIVIPMSGTGRRFRQAGYAEPKPLILVDGKPIIEHVVGMYPGESDFVFICNEEHLQSTGLRQVLQRIAPQGRIVAIAPHKLGPVHAVLAAADLIADDQPVMVNYCDFSVEWDWPALKAQLLANGCDGAVPAYWGFHPHCLGSTNYAYMRHQDQWMLQIQEKQPFTAKRMDEPASSGSYWFRRGSDLKRCFRELMGDPGQALNGEYYVSLAYNGLVRDGLKVWIPRVPVMLQWGIPEDLEEYQAWSDYFHQWRAWRPTRPFDGQQLIPMAGAGQRFVDAGYSQPKPLIPVDGEAMVVRAAAMLPLQARRIFLARPEHAVQASLTQAFGPQTLVLPVAALTAGQASTCLLAREHLDLAAPLMIGACDNGMVWDEAAFAALIADPSVDFVAWTFRGHPGARRKPQAYGWVRADAQGRIQAVSVKAPISDSPQKDPGIVGAFWFRRAGDFVQAADAMIAADERVNGEFYVDSALNWALKQGRQGRLFDVRHYLGWGTPDDLRTWDYWSGHFKRVPRRA
jgi:molybdopterin-guanine dinucleotide biosynthesis protein A